MKKKHYYLVKKMELQCLEFCHAYEKGIVYVGFFGVGEKTQQK